jgi:hypothetical protein
MVVLIEAIEFCTTDVVKGRGDIPRVADTTNDAEVHHNQENVQ